VDITMRPDVGTRILPLAPCRAGWRALASAPRSGVS
jgi:hypothetical protein